MKKRNLFLGFVCLSALLLGGCGSKKASESTPASSGQTSQSESHVHDYQFDSFIWTETPGAYTAVARYICPADKEHEDHDATVTKVDAESVAPTCEAGGKNTWHAEYDGHEDTKVETLDSLGGHLWGEPAWQWGGLFQTATATFTCQRDPNHTHVETATKEGGGIVLHEHKDATCTVDGSDTYRATVTFGGKEYTNDKVDVIPAYEHSDIDIHGFCELCGEYQGSDIANPADGVSFESLAAGTYYYRFQYNVNNEYKISKDKFNASEIFTYIRPTKDTWKQVTLSVASYTTIEESIDSYVYVVLTPAAALTNGYVKFLNQCAHLHIDDYGFCEDCDEYQGLTIAKADWDKEVTMPNVGEGGIIFIRAEIEKGTHISLYAASQPWEQGLEDQSYFLKDGDAFVKIEESEFIGVYSTPVKDRKGTTPFFEVGERKNDGYLYMVLDVDDQDTLTDDTIKVSTEHSADVDNYGFCVMDDGEFAGKEIKIGYANTLGLKAGEKAFYRFADDGYHSYKRTYKSALAADDFTFYRKDSAGSMVEITVDNTFRMLEPSEDEYYYVVICPDKDVPSGSFTIVQEELSVFTVAYYAKFMPEDKITTLTNGLNDYFHINATDVDRIIFKTLGDAKTDVAGLAGLITDFNSEHSGHEIDVILGCRADKDKKLSDAGYQAFDTTDYTYGDPDESARRLWCQKGQTEDAHVLAVRSYLQENWKAS